MAKASKKETRVKVWCDECRQFDDHPRHVVLQADGSMRVMHMDCCRDSGTCTDKHCHDILLESGELHGYELLAWIKENR